MDKRIFHLRSRGFSLVELMVGVLIGLITVLVATQVLTNAMKGKRATSSGADSVVNVTLGLYVVERDIKNAGFGLTSVRATIGCKVNARFGSTDREFNLVPVVITDGADGAPDTIRVLASDKNNASLPIRILKHNVNAATIFVDSDFGITDGDMMVAVPATDTTKDCTLFQGTVSGEQGGGQGGQQGQNNGNSYGQRKVSHPNGQSGWNHPGSGIFPSEGYDAGDYLINLGNLIDRTYSVDNGSLLLTTYDMPTDTTSEPASVYPHIVQMQAVYGKDTNGDGAVDAWNEDMPTMPAEWQQITAIRMALVTRGESPEPGNVTLTGDNCDALSPPPTAVCWHPVPGQNGVAINVNINNANPDWQRFRYRVLETTIPLRNVIWHQL